MFAPRLFCTILLYYRKRFCRGVHPRYLWHKFQLAASRLTKREVAASEREYWARRAVGSGTWEDLNEDAR